MVPSVGKWRWIAGLAVMALMFLAGASLVARHRPQSFVVSSIATVFPADGREHAVLRVTRSHGGLVQAAEVTAEAIAGSSREDLSDLRIVQTGRDVEVWMRAPVMAGERQLRVRWGRRAVVEKVRFAPDDVDSFGDGMPDALRLHRSTTELHSGSGSGDWLRCSQLPDTERAAEIQDCAALLRYSFRDALNYHDAEWAGAHHVGDVAFESVRQWRYPETMLGTGLFRVRPGPFVEGDDSNGAFRQFADAHALMSWNTYLVGRSVRAAKPGDLIFFRQFEENSPYHSMVITGSDADWVVYHTGPIGKHKGKMRRMALADLLRHPDARWRPVAENSNFLGVFRWNVLREGD